MGGCCYACLKYLVMVFNLIYMLIGLAVQGFMLWIYFDEEVYGNIAKDVHGYNWVIFILMGIGTVVTIMGFLGCCGALQESQCMLATFFAFVLILFASQIAVFVMVYENTETFKSITVKQFKDSFQEHYTYNNIKTRAMDKMQIELSCCGAEGPSDWQGAKFNNGSRDIGTGEPTPFIIPQSCCRKSIDIKTCEAVRKIKVVGSLKDNFYSDGCANIIIDAIEENTFIIYISLFVVAFIEILAMIFSMVLCCTARKIDQYKA